MKKLKWFMSIIILLSVILFNPNLSDAQEKTNYFIVLQDVKTVFFKSEGVNKF